MICYHCKKGLMPQNLKKVNGALYHTSCYENGVVFCNAAEPQVKPAPIFKASKRTHSAFPPDGWEDIIERNTIEEKESQDG